MLNKYDKYYKEYLKLIKRLNKIIKQRRLLPYVECIPYQNGWNAFITLREDILNRDDADFIIDLIKIGYEEKRTIRTLKEVKLIRKEIYEYFVNDKYIKDKINLIPKRKKLTEKEYENLTERQKPYFSKWDRWISYYNKNPYYKINIPIYWIKLKVKPNMITKMRDISPELESEFKKIRDKLSNPPYSKYFYNRCSDRFNLKKDKNYIKEQTRLEIKNYVE